MLSTIQATFDQNMGRVENVVVLHASIPGAKGSGRKGHKTTDVLRSAVVLLHATLEECCRGIAHWKLPEAEADALDEIPLVGTGPSPKKFQLGALAPHRDKTVRVVIEESVAAHLKQSNFNNTDEIAHLLASVGVDIDKVNSSFPALQEFMERRHQIVHRADRQDIVVGSGDHRVRSLSRSAVQAWIQAVKQFGAEVFRELGP